jgi:hypothetical protein
MHSFGLFAHRPSTVASRDAANVELNDKHIDAVIIAAAHASFSWLKSRLSSDQHRPMSSLHE